MAIFTGEPSSTFRRLLTIFCLLVIGVTKASSLVRDSSATDSLVWSYSITSSGFYSDNGPRRLLINSLGIVNVRKVSFSNRLVINHQFGEVASQLRENDVLSYDIFRIRDDRLLFPFTIVGIESSRTRGLNFRWIAGAGGGIYIVRNKAVYLEFTTSALHEDSDYKGNEFKGEQGITSNELSRWRLSPRISGYLKIDEQNVQLRYEGWIQPAFKEFSDYQGYGNISLLVPIIKRVFLQLGWIFTYESVVLEGHPNLDSIINFGVTFKSDDK